MSPVDTSSTPSSLQTSDVSRELMTVSSSDGVTTLRTLKHSCLNDSCGLVLIISDTASDSTGIADLTVENTFSRKKMKPDHYYTIINLLL